MSNLYLWIPKDFDKRYIKYRAKFVEKETPKPSILDNLTKEKESILSIKDERLYQDELDKWKPVNVILNEIYKKLSPFKEVNQTIEIDISKLGIPENISDSVLTMLFEEGLCMWRVSSNPVVVTSQRVREYLKGNGIIIKSYRKFKDFRFDINNFYFSVESLKNTKFPANPKLESKKELQLKVLGEMVEKDKKEDELAERIFSRVNHKLQKNEQTFPLDINPVIKYSSVTGRGQVMGGKKFQFKDGSAEYNIFNQLYSKMPKKLERQNVLIAGGFYKDYEEPDPARKTNETAFINDKVKTLREKTGLNTEQIANNNGNLTLIAKKYDKPTPKPPQTPAVWG